MSNTVKFLKVVNRDQCTGCFSCMYACSRMQHNHGGAEKAALRVYPRTGVEGAFSLRACAACEEPDCVAVCPNGALTATPGGGLRLERELCIHCRKCVRGCKISALRWDWEEKFPIPCVHCGQCVKYCPNGVFAMKERESQNTHSQNVRGDALESRAGGEGGVRKQGNILFIDLTNLTSRVERDEELFEQFMGGTAVASELLFRHGRPDLDPYAPEAPMIFAVGPFNSLYPVASKTVAMFKSPLSGELGESYAGGRLSRALRAADIDALVVTGQASSPVYLVIEGHKVTFSSAKTIWGKSAPSTERLIRDAAGDNGHKLSVLRIGPAGERRSPIACVTVDGSRHFGRLGLGGVMGAKNLKALAVFGHMGQTFKKEEIKAFREVYDVLYDRVVHSMDMSKYHDIGTASGIATLSGVRGLPVSNFSQGTFGGAEFISGEKFAKDHLSQHTACAHCQCGCIHLATLREEYKPWHYATSKVSYDYELIYAFGSVLSISTSQDVLRLIAKAEREGWDAISMGVTLAWATEAYLNGVLGDKETDGLPLAFGDAECYMEMMRRCAAGEGEFFRDLESGCAKCAAKWGGEEFAIHYGKVEPGGYMTGENMAITSLLGVRHSHLDDTGYSIDQALLNKPMPVAEQVAQQVKEAQWRMILNSLVVCLFARRGIYDQEIILKGLSALSLDWTPEKLDALGKRALQRKHEWKKLCGCDIGELKVPSKMFRVRSATGHMKEDSIKERVRLYRELAEI